MTTVAANTARPLSVFHSSRSVKTRYESMESKGVKIKALYPEMESWGEKFLGRTWLIYTRTTGIKPAVPETRDEAFPDFVIKALMDLSRADDPKRSYVILSAEDGELLCTQHS